MTRRRGTTHLSAFRPTTQAGRVGSTVVALTVLAWLAFLLLPLNTVPSPVPRVSPTRHLRPIRTRHQRPIHHVAISPTPSSVVPTPSTVVPTPSTTIPRESQTLFSNTRIVAYYGAPGGGSLGILGATDPQAAWSGLTAQAAAYDQPGTVVEPAFELIAFVAQAAPGPNGLYTQELSVPTIGSYLSVIEAHHGMLILDIQPGRSSPLADARLLAPFLANPNVELGLDPEWEVAAPSLPGQVIGSTTGAEINTVATWLSQFVSSHNLPPKLLLVHEFTPTMVAQKASVTSPPGIQIVFNMDGFGSWAAKTSAYSMLASDPRFPLGIKLFYRQDQPLEPPATVLELRPIPSVIEYQ